MSEVERPPLTPATVTGVILLTFLAVLVSLEAVFFLPLYFGSVPVPISALGAAVMLYVCPRALFRLTGRLWAAALPAVVWLVITAWLALWRNTLYPLPVAVGDWRITVLFGLGAVAAALSIGLCWGDTMRVPAASSPERPAGSPD